jgi:EmrB/QacA subfamily drug resistance transporter
MQQEAAEIFGAERRAPLAWPLASLSLSILLASLGMSIANVALPTLTLAFDASFQAAQWVVLAYLLSTTTLVVSAGRLGDILGRRRLLLAGLLLFTGASLVCGVASALWQLIAARAAQGLGAATMMALAMAFVGETVPKEKTGSAMGLLGTTSAIGTALGPSLGGILIGGFGWRSVFFVNVPLGMMALALAHRSLKRDRDDKATQRGTFDLKGTIVLALALATYALATTTGNGHFGSANAVLLLAAGTGAALFVLIEASAATPLVQLAMFRNSALTAGFATSALVATVMMTTLVVGPFYLSGALGLDAARVGLVMSVGPLVAAFAGVPAGRLVDWFGANRMTFAGLAGVLVGSISLSVIPAAAGIPGYVVALATMTVGYALFQAANNTVVMADAPQDRRGVISGMLNLARNLGLMTGASVMGAVFTFMVGGLDIATARPAAIAVGMRATFAVAAGLVLVAVLSVAVSRAIELKLSAARRKGAGA